MERLSFQSKVGYNAIEAAIHMARYQLAAPYCRGRRILDVACGEGYGSHTLKQWGAASVDGVDNSTKAIKTARSLFSATGIRYHVHDAVHVDELFGKRRFDVVVSLETIEHIRSPELFLRVIMKVAKKDAVIIISCPNDHWYYATDQQSNPFHVRKYSFEMFRDLTTGVLGDDVVWGYGVPIIGFGNVRDDLSAGKDPMIGQIAMLDFHKQAASVAMPPRGFSNVGPRNCSYFVGVWGGKSTRIYTSAFVPISMDQYTNLVSWEAANKSPARIDQLENEVASLASSRQAIELQVRELVEERDRGAAQIEVFRSRAETASAEIAARDGFIANLEVQLASADEQRERYRVQALALAKELEIATGQLRRITDERDQLISAAAAALDNSAPPDSPDLTAQPDSEVLRELEDRLMRVQQECEAHRIQAFALAKELDIVTRQVQQISHERDRLLADPSTGFATLLREKQGLEERLRATMQVPGWRSPRLRDRLVASAKALLLMFARRVKRYLPAILLKAAQSIARRLRM
jgi:SAM-dependent methyltransferase